MSEDKIVLRPRGEEPKPTDLKMLGLPIPIYQHEALERLKEQTKISKQELVAMAIDEFLKRAVVEE